MPKKHILSYKSPQGEIHAEADSFSELENMVSERISRMVTTQSDIEKMSLDDAAKAALNVYYISHRRRSHTSISKAGVELDVAKCYLQNMTYLQITQWLEVNKKVSISLSAVGRICTRLFRLGIAPIGSEHAYAFKLLGDTKRGLI